MDTLTTVDALLHWRIFGSVAVLPPVVPLFPSSLYFPPEAWWLRFSAPPPALFPSDAVSAGCARWVSRNHRSRYTSFLVFLFLAPSLAPPLLPLPQPSTAPLSAAFKRRRCPRRTCGIPGASDGVATVVGPPSVDVGGVVPAVGSAGLACTPTDPVNAVSGIHDVHAGGGRCRHRCGCDIVLGHRRTPSTRSRYWLLRRCRVYPYRRLSVLCCSRFLECSGSLSLSIGWLRDGPALDGLFLRLSCDGRGGVCLRLCNGCCCLLLCFFIVLVVAKDGFLVFLCRLFGFEGVEERSGHWLRDRLGSCDFG